MDIFPANEDSDGMITYDSNQTKHNNQQYHVRNIPGKTRNCLIMIQLLGDERGKGFSN